MRQIIVPHTHISLLDKAQCERLFVQQKLPDGAALGSGHTLPASQSTWRDYYANTMPTFAEPWWVDCTTDGGLLLVDASLAYFTGHFPDRPLLPGVVQLNWCIIRAAQLFEQAPRGKFSGLARVKFLMPILPGAVLRLVLRPQAGKIFFELTTADAIHTRGTLLYRG